MSQSFDFDKALKDLQAGKDLTGKDGVLMPLIKQLTEAHDHCRIRSSPGQR